MRINIKNGFTLVELIVVITILAILGTISFMALNGYSTNARNSARSSDLSSLKSALELYSIKVGGYPDPSNGVPITYSGGTAWTQGTVGNSIIKNLSSLNKKPVDPLLGNEYTYSLLNTRGEYQLGSIEETGYGNNTVMPAKAGIYENSIIPNSYAANSTAKAIIIGNYNGQLLKVSTGGVDYVLAIPSIITTDITIKDIGAIISNKTLAYNSYTNLPGSYNGKGYTMTGGFIYQPSNIVLLTGSTSTLSTNLANSSTLQIALIDNLKSAYVGTVLTTDPNISQIINVTNSTDKQNLVSGMFRNKVAGLLGQIKVETIAETNGNQYCNGFLLRENQAMKVYLNVDEACVNADSWKAPTKQTITGIGGNYDRNGVLDPWGELSNNNNDHGYFRINNGSQDYFEIYNNSRNDYFGIWKTSGAFNFKNVYLDQNLPSKKMLVTFSQPQENTGFEYYFKEYLVRPQINVSSTGSTTYYDGYSWGAYTGNPTPLSINNIYVEYKKNCLKGEYVNTEGVCESIYKCNSIKPIGTSETYWDYIIGTPTMVNQAWQNTNSNNPCYYVCKNGPLYYGENCDQRKYTVSGSFGSLGGQSTINVCGINYTTGDGTFSVTRNQGSNCSNIIATKPGFLCTTDVNGPANLNSDVNNISGSCYNLYYGDLPGEMPYIRYIRLSSEFSFYEPSTYGSNAGGTSVVNDLTTGLQWQSNVGSINGLSWQGGKDYCYNLNLGGFTDWRLPDLTELSSINPLLSAYFSDPNLYNSTDNIYWSSIIKPENTSDAYVFSVGSPSYGYKPGIRNRGHTSFNSLVRCVRGIGNKLPWQGVKSGYYDPNHHIGSSAIGETRFSIIGGGDVVYDSKTKLNWQKNGMSSGFIIGTRDSGRNQAINYCSNLVIGGYDDWRVPNIKELTSIIDFGKNDGDTYWYDSYFISSSQYGYISRTQDQYNSINTNVISPTTSGVSTSAIQDSTGNYYVRCVR